MIKHQDFFDIFLEHGEKRNSDKTKRPTKAKADRLLDIPLRYFTMDEIESEISRFLEEIADIIWAGEHKLNSRNIFLMNICLLMAKEGVTLPKSLVKKIIVSFPPVGGYYIKLGELVETYPEHGRAA